ncbi:MAG: tetratricopeptide repeat protein [Terracidiphilus sp.]
METERWKLVDNLLQSALELAPERREEFLAEACGSDSALVDEINSLLTSHRRAGDFLERPAMEIAARAMAADEAPTFAQPLVGQVVSHYRILKLIGRGGMGSVWLAERCDGRFERKVAIKFISLSVLDAAGAERFKREGAILGKLSHPQIAELIDAGVTSTGEPFLVLEYVEGHPIDEYCDDNKLSVDARIRLFLDVLSAVAHAHSNLIVHRDIKPSNVFIRNDAQVKLLDFGIAKVLAEDAAQAKLTAEASRVLTPQYAAPEQLTGNAITTATDVYLLGVLLFELLTGKHPTGTSLQSPADLVKSITETEARLASQAVTSANDTDSSEKRRATPEKLHRVLRGDLDTIIAKTLKKKPEERYASVTALADDLHRFLKHEPIAARPDTLPYRMRKYVRRHLVGVAVAAALVALLAGFAVTQAVELRRITRERDRANRIADFMTGVFKVSDPNERVGDTVTARAVLDKAATDIDSSLSNDPDLKAQMMRVMGRAYLNLGIFSRAQGLFDRSIQIGGSFDAQSDRGTLQAMHDLAWALVQQGRLAEAEKLARKVLDLQRRVMGPDHPDTLGTMGELAFILCQEGNCAEAVKINREVLEKQKRLLGPDAYGTLTTMDNLAGMLHDSGQMEEAMVVQRESLDRHLRVLGPENIGTINAMLNFAELQRDTGQDDAAIKTLNDLMGVERRVLDPDQGEIAATKYDLASVLVRKGKTVEALALLDEVIDHLPPRIALGLEADPLFAPLQGDPRLAALVTRAKAQASSHPPN